MGEQRFGSNARQLLWVSDIVKAGNAGVVETDRKNAIDLPVESHNQCWVPVNRDVLDCEGPLDLWEAVEEQPDDSICTNYWPQDGLFEPATVAHEDDFGCDHRDEVCQIAGFDCEAEYLQSFPGLTWGDPLAGAARFNVSAGAVRYLADGYRRLVDCGGYLAIGDIEDLTKDKDGSFDR